MEGKGMTSTRSEEKGDLMQRCFGGRVSVRSKAVLSLGAPMCAYTGSGLMSTQSL